MKKNKKFFAGFLGLLSLLFAKFVAATSAIDNDTLAGLPQLGSDLGSFLQNLAPGVGVFIIILGIFGGIAAIVYAIVYVIKKKIRR